MLPAHQHAQDVRERLRNPPNAIPDQGIDLKRKPVLVSSRNLAPVQRWLPRGPVPEDLAGVVQQMQTLQRQLDETTDRYEQMVGMLADRRPKIREICAVVARLYDVKVAEIVGDCREKRFVRPRHVVFYLAKQLTFCSLVSIGRQMRGRDHTSVLNGVWRIEEALKIDPELATTVEILKSQLRPAAYPSHEAQHAISVGT